MSVRAAARTPVRRAGLHVAPALLPALLLALPLALLVGGPLPDGTAAPESPLLATGLLPEERAVAERVLAATVALAVTDAGERPSETSAAGTGFVVREDGLIATSWRLLAGLGRDKRLWAQAPGGPWVVAVPLGATWWCDVGLVRLATARSIGRALTFADATREQVGQRFLAVGAPVGRARLAAASVLAAVEWFDPDQPGSRLESSKRRAERPGKRAALTALRFGEEAWTRTALGAPVVDAEGRCVGLVAGPDPTRTPEDRVTVRPAALLRLAIDAIARESSFDPADLGLRFSPAPLAEGAAVEVPEELAVAREKAPGGALVTHVEPHGPSNGRVWEGDVVLAIEGRPVVAEIPASFALALLPVAAGAQVEVTVLRGGKPQPLRVPTSRARQVYADWTAEHDARGAGLLAAVTPPPR